MFMWHFLMWYFGSLEKVLVPCLSSFDYNLGVPYVGVLILVPVVLAIRLVKYGVYAAAAGSLHAIRLSGRLLGGSSTVKSGNEVRKRLAVSVNWRAFSWVPLTEVLPFGVYIKVPDSWKLPQLKQQLDSTWTPKVCYMMTQSLQKIAKRLSFYILLGSRCSFMTHSKKGVDGSVGGYPNC